MKKGIVLMLAMCMVLTFAACGNGDVNGNLGGLGGNGLQGSGTQTDAAVFTAEDCLNALMKAKNAADLNGIVTNPTADYAEQVADLIGNDTYTCTAQKVGDYKGYELYRFQITSNTDASKQMSGVEVFVRNGDRYVIENSQTVIDMINAEILCPTCRSSGTTTGGGSICGFCGGTGLRWQENVYYDPATGMWMGQNITCSSCGGAGQFGAQTVVCGTCGGAGVIIP